MKKIPFAALLALTGLGLIAQTAHAGTTTYAANGDDLFLGFRQDNNTTADILIDLGQTFQYRDATVTGSLNSIIGTGLEGPSGLLATSFGSGWFTDPTVHWGLVATSGTNAQTTNGVVETNNTLYISNPETNATPPTSSTNSVQNGAGNKILTMEGQWVGKTTSTGLLNGLVETPSATSWNGEAGSSFGDATQFGQFESNPNASSEMDLYRISRSGANSPADGNKGTFTIDSTGQVFYNSTATPEPTAISLLGGAGLLLLARRRRTPAAA